MKELPRTVSCCRECPYRERIFSFGVEYFKTSDKRTTTLNICMLGEEQVNEDKFSLKVIDDLDSIADFCKLMEVEE